ncbi:hypothetical protein [Conexibacter woesei]|uniref:hypothetical protein n=1 Tax=Conexibacter woesei TaxID=191495 RepID=UPI0012DFDC95|nr:hypothetical protein [Conexibacter woesei]
MLTLNDNNWRRVESGSIEELVERVLVWVVVLVLLGVVAYCAVTAKPLYATGGMVLLLGSVVHRTRGGDA